MSVSTLLYFSFDSDFDRPESQDHGDDEDFDPEAYLKWKEQDAE